MSVSHQKGLLFLILLVKLRRNGQHRSLDISDRSNLEFVISKLTQSFHEKNVLIFVKFWPITTLIIIYIKYWKGTSLDIYHWLDYGRVWATYPLITLFMFANEDSIGRKLDSVSNFSVKITFQTWATVNNLDIFDPKIGLAFAHIM